MIYASRRLYTYKKSSEWTAANSRKSMRFGYGSHKLLRRPVRVWLSKTTVLTSLESVTYLVTLTACAKNKFSSKSKLSMEISSNFSVLTNIESFQDKNNFTDSSLNRCNVRTSHHVVGCLLMNTSVWRKKGPPAWTNSEIVLMKIQGKTIQLHTGLWPAQKIQY